MKQFSFLLTIISSFLLANSAFAQDNGFYTGILLGQSKIDSTVSNQKVKTAPVLNSNSNTKVSGPAQPSIDNDGFAGRAYVGYNFNRYFAIEGGYTQYADTKISNIFGVAGDDENLSEGAIDTVARLNIPLSKRFNLYGKGGAAFVMANQVTDAYAVPTGDTYQFHYEKTSLDRVRPTFGVGLDMDITRYLSTEISFASVIGGNGISTSDLLAIGINCHFPSKSSS
jgi:opacity protein-like surface antigen